MLTGLSVYLPESLLTVFDNLEFLIRIVLAAILGAMVGLERTKQQKDVYKRQSLHGAEPDARPRAGDQ